MPRYIDADARKAELKEKEKFGEIGHREYTLMEYALDFAPTADVVERKKGKWIFTDGVRCSNCYHKLQTTGLPMYCPNCWADMREGKTNDH